MDRLRSMKNRLSLSVDRLSGNNDSYSKLPDDSQQVATTTSYDTTSSAAAFDCTQQQQQQQDVNLSEPCSDSGLFSGVGSPPSVRTIDINKPEQRDAPALGKPVQSPPDSLNQSYDCLKGFPESLKNNDFKSLMDEIMTEVSKLSCDTIEENPSVPKQKVETTSVPEVNSKLDLKFDRDYRHSSEELLSKATDSSFSEPSATDNDVLTSGYFSDSASEGVMSLHRKKGSKEKMSSEFPPIPSSYPVPMERKKKEGIYAKLKRATKRDSSTSRPSKEPIYARIRPKLKTDSDFRPINPINVAGDNTNIVRPEPIYYTKQKVHENQRYTISVTDNTTSITSSNTSSFLPITSQDKFSPTPNEVDNTVKAKSKSLPHEPFYKRIMKKESLPTTEEKGKPVSPVPKQPIYNQPLPAIPSKDNDVSKSFSNYGMVKVKAKEILTTKANIITISNPAYAKPASSPSFSGMSRSTASPSESTPCSSLSSVATTSLPEKMPKNKEFASKNKLNGEISKEGPSQQAETLNSELLIKGDDINKDENSDKPTYSRLVKELAEELEFVTQRTGFIDEADDVSKREVLMKLLSTYDVPKNIRRVEKASSGNEEINHSFVPMSVSPDELRFVDDNEDSMVYTDVPDFSQDEFVIALDDINEPKYASLTRDRQGADSPGRVSRRSAQVYVNVINVISALKVLINSNSTKAVTVINKMGTLARPYAQKVQTSIGDTQWIQRKIYHKSGHNGFDELRRYIKSGGEFCKELAVVMHERAELESSYAKGLHKLSSKLVKASRETLGSVSEAWQTVGAELQHEGDIHRLLASSITEEVVRPLRQLIETQHKIRKGVETIVDKTTKNLYDWRTAEAKSKKNSFHNNRENEKIQQMSMEARMGKGKILSDRDFFKLEKQKKKAEDAVDKSDHEYYTFCVKSERSRQEWESAVYRGSSCFQTLEEERLMALKNLVEKYYNSIKDIAPKLNSTYERLEEPINKCDVSKDIASIVAAKGTGQNNPEQQLPDLYCEDFNTAMNTARRREALEKFSKMVRTDLEREKRGKQGIENLAKALQETPNFGGEDSQQDVNDKLQHMKAMLAYLEASRYKVQRSLDELTNKPRLYHPFARHIETCRDKQGILVSVLKVPPWVRSEQSSDICSLSNSPEISPDWNDRGTADGTSMQPESDFVRGDLPLSFMYPYRYPSLILSSDEFSSQGSDHEYLNAFNGGLSVHNDVTRIDDTQKVAPEEGLHQTVPDGTYYAQPLTAVQASGRCKALYDYEANMYDELSIKTGDIINIHEKQPDGWWVGELEGIVGIFPATYVEEIDFTN